MNILFVCHILTHGEKNQTSDICSLWWILRIPCFAKEAKCIIACTVYSISYDVAELTFAGRNEVVYSKALLSPVLRAFPGLNTPNRETVKSLKLEPI